MGSVEPCTGVSAKSFSADSAALLGTFGALSLAVYLRQAPSPIHHTGPSCHRFLAWSGVGRGWRGDRGDQGFQRGFLAYRGRLSVRHCAEELSHCLQIV